MGDLDEEIEAFIALYVPRSHKLPRGVRNNLAKHLKLFVRTVIQEAIKEGMEKASKVPVAQKITESFVSIAKKAVSEIPESKIKSNPKEIKSALDELDKAFNNLFDARKSNWQTDRK